LNPNSRPLGLDARYCTFHCKKIIIHVRSKKYYILQCRVSLQLQHSTQLQPTLQTHQQNKIIKLLTQKIKIKLSKKLNLWTYHVPSNIFSWTSIKLISNVKNSTLFLGFNSTQVSMGQFLMMRMNWSKLSIPSLKRFRFVMISITLKIYFISIGDFTMPRTWWMKNGTWGNCITWFAH